MEAYEDRDKCQAHGTQREMVYLPKDDRHGEEQEIQQRVQEREVELLIASQLKCQIKRTKIGRTENSRTIISVKRIARGRKRLI